METYGNQLHMIKFSALNYSIIFSLMAQTVPAIPTVDWVKKASSYSIDSPVRMHGVHMHTQHT